MLRAIALGFVVLLLAPEAQAQDPLPEGLRKQSNATSGKTDVATAGFQGTTAKADENDAALVEVSGGGLVASGNSRQVALTTSAKARFRRSAHQGSAAAAVNYAEAASKDTEGLETSVENLQGLLRYDFFFQDRWSAFLSTSARRDRFQGLELRLNIDPGVAYYLLPQPEHMLWLEAGYDFQHDIRRDENRVLPDSGLLLDKAESRHSARGFAGYSNKLNERVAVDTGLEYIQSVEQSSKWRLNWDVSMTSNIAGRFSTAVALILRYDHEPLPDVKTLDVLTSFNLVYALL